MKVLIVEDEPLIAMYLERTVKDFGYCVCGVAASTHEAISLAASEHPHIALMDIHLAGGSSGIDAAWELFQRYEVSCIFLSASLDAEVRDAVDQCKPIAFIDKPVLPIVLERALKEGANSIRGQMSEADV